MIKFIKKNLAFLLPFDLFFSISIIFIFIFSKIDIHLFLNSFHTPFLDTFFKYFTHLGDGFVIVFFITFLLFWQRKNAIMLTIIGVLQLIIIRTLKLLSSSPRPMIYFENNEILPLVEGVNMHYYNSFPSGHTATAFSLFFFLAMIVKNKLLKFSLFLIALFVGFSRIYLSQHFLIDVVFGALIGIVISFVVKKMMRKK